MDRTIHDHAAGRHSPADEPDHDSNTSADGPQAGSAAPTLVICAWCPGLNILSTSPLPAVGERRTIELVIVGGKLLEAWIECDAMGELAVKQTKMAISHGICPTCSSRLRIPAGSAPDAQVR